MDAKTRWIALVGAVAAITAIIIVIQVTVKPAPPAPAGSLPVAAPSTETGQAAEGPTAPEFAGVTRWLNSQPLTVASLKSKVVIVDFWTYTCVNCLRTLPYLKDWNEKYASKGLVIVGVHSPEFDFEKDEANVRQAVAKEGVTWPVAMDNDFGTWRAYRNRYWPHKFLLDKNGVVRYDHIGEGGYTETELQIRRLLTEAGADVSKIAVGLPNTVKTDDGSGIPITRELYTGLSWDGGGYLANVDKPVPGVATFTDPGRHQDGQIYLHGQWELTKEYARHARTTQANEDYVAIAYLARSVNVVVQPMGNDSFRVVATLNGAPLPEDARGDDIKLDEKGNTYFEVNSSRLYNVVRSQRATAGELQLSANSEDFLLYTYTFGS